MDYNCQYPEIRDHQTKHKKRLTQDQVRLLESNFNFNKKLDPDRKAQLALELSVPPRQVAIWYQNKRARDKIQGIEVEHKALQRRLGDVLADNERLREEVERLRFELSRMGGPLGSSFNSASSGDEVGSSNLVMKESLEREFYASLNDGFDFFG